MNSGTVAYTTTEIQSVLPSGWALLDGALPPPAKKPKRPLAFTARVQDGAEVDWPLEISADAVHRLGRMEALRQAMDKLYREALG
jgi:hypothetical protein